MSATIDKRIVEMAFENSKFEQNVGTSLNTIDKLKRSLNFSGSEKAFDGITRSAGRVNLGPISDGVSAIADRFSALGVIGMGVLFNLTNAALAAGQRIVNALVIDPIKTGLNEYETKLNSVQTILANTQKEGTNLEIVTKALNDLNEYSDKTIYNFQQMARNIGTFTAAGIKLDTSVSAIKGIANLAAVSGSNADQASTAMYQLSQALSTGTVRLMDWNSVVNAGMGGQVFQDAIMETARVHGVAIDQIIKEEGSFRDSLQRGWFTSEILTETLAKFTGDLNAEQLKAMGYTEDQIAGIIKMGQTANDAATKVKTFSQLMQTLAEAAQSGWAQTWEIIIGDFDEAKAFLTDLNNFFGGLIGTSADARNELLQGWSDLGGRTKLIEAFQNAINAVVTVLNPIRDAMREIFPPVTAKNLMDLTTAVSDFIKKLILGADGIDKVKRIFKGIFSIFDIGRMAVVAIGKEFFRLIGYLTPVGGSLTDLIAKLGDFFVKLRDNIKTNQIFTKVMRTIGDTILLIAGVVKTGIDAFVKAFDRFKDLRKSEGFFKSFAGALASFFGFFKNLDFDFLKDIGERIKERFAFIGQIGEFIKNAFNGVKAETNPFREKLMKIAGNIWMAIKGFILSVLDAISKIDFSNINFNKIFDGINGGLLAALLISITRFVSKGTGIFSSIVDIFKDVKGFAENANGVLAGITTIMTGVKDILTAWQQQVRAGILMKIAGAIALLAASLLVLSLIDSEKLTGALAAITLLFSNLFGAMAAYEKVSGGVTGIPAMAKGVGGMIGLATAVLILSGALVNLSQIPTEDITKGVLGLTVLVGALVGASVALTKSGATVITGAGSMILFSIALRTLIGPVKTLGSIDTSALTRGLVGLAVMLAEVSIFMRTMSFNVSNLDDFVGLLILSGAISMLAGVIKQLGAIDASSATQGLTVLGVLLAGLGVFAKSTTGGGSLILTATGMLILSGAMTVLADVLTKIGKMSWEQLAVGLTGLGGALLIVAVAMNAMTAGITGAFALLVAAGALAIMVPMLKMLGTMSIEQVGIALLALAGAFTVLGLAASILTPLLPSLVALGLAIGIFGVAILAAGIGVLAFSTAMAALAVTGAAGGAAVAAALLAVAAILPTLATAAALGIIQFAKTIKDGAPIIFEAASALMLGFLTAVTENIPSVVTLVLTMITSLLDGIKSQLPQIVQSGYDIIIGFLNGIRSNIYEVTTLAIDIITNFLDAISSRLPELVDSGWKLIISWIDSMTAAVEEHLPELITSVQALGIAIVQGVVDGMFGMRRQAIDGIKELGQKLIDGFKEILGIHSPSTVFFSFAQNIIDGLINGIKAYISRVRENAKYIVDTLIAGVRSGPQGMLNAGKDLVQGFANGIRNYISTAVNAAAQLAREVLGKIKSVLGINSPAKELIEVGKYADQGLAKGISQFSSVVLSSIKGLGQDTISGFTSVVSKISDALDSGLDVNPTIRPVIDLTNIESGAGKIQDMLGNQTLNMSLTTSNAGRIQTQQPNISEPIPATGATQASISFTQNNYSPKELSRIDIYRQTRNQLLMAQKGLQGVS